MLDYTPALVSDLHRLHKLALGGNDRELISRLSGALHESPKFILPTGAFRNIDKISDTERELFVPPYGISVWEYSYPSDMQIEDTIERDSNTKIKNTDVVHRVNILMRNNSNNTDSTIKEWLFAMFQRTNNSKWIIHPCTAGFNREDIDGSQIVSEAGYLEFVLDGRFSDEELDDMHHDMGYEIATVIKAIAMLNCENVEHEAVERPVSRLKKQRFRKKYGIEPYQYRVLKISGESTYTKDGTSTPREAGVRYHLRRGHFRRYQSGKVTWVRACKVGDINVGRVEKVYQL